MAGPWEKYQAPAADGPWAKYGGQQQEEPPAPLSGPIPGTAAVPEPNMTQEVNQGNLREGLKGMGKEFASTMQGIHNFNNPENGNAPVFIANPAKGILNMNTDAENPDQMAGKAVGMGLEAIAPMGGIKEALPSTARAGKVFQSVMQDAMHEPVSLTRSAGPLQRLAELDQRGGTMPKGASQMLTRSQAISPMNYPEARDFYSNLSKPSIFERMNISPEAKSQMGKLLSGFRADIGDAAENVGRGEDYSNAMSEYRQAKTLQKIGKYAAGSGIVGLGAKAIGAGGIMGLLNKLKPE